MADDEVFNFTAFCEDTTGNVTDQALCALNDGLASTQFGLDTFFLLFGVSTPARSRRLFRSC